MSDGQQLHEIQSLIEKLHEKYRTLTDGQVAAYIPELSRANPEHFGLRLVTTDGQIFETGNCDVPFTIQSISKPFVFAAATPSTRLTFRTAQTVRTIR